MLRSRRYISLFGLLASSFCILCFHWDRVRSNFTNCLSNFLRFTQSSSTTENFACGRLCDREVLFDLENHSFAERMTDVKLKLLFSAWCFTLQGKKHCICSTTGCVTQSNDWIDLKVTQVPFQLSAFYMQAQTLAMNKTFIMWRHLTDKTVKWVTDVTAWQKQKMGEDFYKDWWIRKESWLDVGQ